MARRQPQRQSARRGRKDGGLEVEDSGTAESMSLEQGLVLVTFVALLAGLILAQIGLSDHGGGLF